MWQLVYTGRLPALRGTVERDIYYKLCELGGASWSNEIVQQLGTGKNKYLNRMVEKGIVVRVQAWKNPMGMVMFWTGDREKLVVSMMDRLMQAIYRTRTNTTRTYWVIADQYCIDRLTIIRSR